MLGFDWFWVVQTMNFGYNCKISENHNEKILRLKKKENKQTINKLKKISTCKLHIFLSPFRMISEIQYFYRLWQIRCPLIE